MNFCVSRIKNDPARDGLGISRSLNRLDPDCDSQEVLSGSLSPDRLNDDQQSDCYHREAVKSTRAFCVHVSSDSADDVEASENRSSAAFSSDGESLG